MAATIQLTKTWKAPCWCQGTPCKTNPDADHLTEVAKGTRIEAVLTEINEPAAIQHTYAECMVQGVRFTLTNWLNRPPEFKVIDL